MTEPMTIERFDEILAAAERWAEGDLKNPTTTSVFRHRAELLAEVCRLKEEVIHFEAVLFAVRGWAVSRRALLERWQSSENAAKTAVLNDLDRVLDDLEILKDEA